jgi:Pyruvate/2-oxoacid:ferredoxin oxidoreductase gamma subunit
LNFVVRPFTELADGLGEPRAGNIVMLGAMLETAGVIAK